MKSFASFPGNLFLDISNSLLRVQHVVEYTQHTCSLCQCGSCDQTDCKEEEDETSLMDQRRKTGFPSNCNVNWIFDKVSKKMQMMSSKTVSKTSNGGKKANMMSLMSCDLFLSINSDIWFCLCCCALKIQDVKSRTEFRSRTITEDGVKVLTGRVLDMFVKKANKPTNRWSPGFKSEQNMFVVLHSVPQQLME